jgi:acetyl-CoA C-acetyltransferase
MTDKSRTPVILSACRTPIGNFLGGLSNHTAPQLGAIAIREAVKRAGIPKPEEIDEVIMGNVVQAGEGQAPGRQAAVHGGVPTSVPAMTINKVCGSGLKAVMLAAQAIKAGDEQLIVAGGMESMSTTPYVLHGAKGGLKFGHRELKDTMILDGLWDSFNNFHMGNAAELTAKKSNISRQEQDEFACNSHIKAAAAQKGCKFSKEIVAVEIPQKTGEPLKFDKDECIRPDTSIEKLARLKPAFQKDGTVTAGNAPGLNDGAAATVISSLEYAEKNGLKPLAKINGYASAGTDPELLFYAPIYAVRKLMKQMGVDINFWDLMETNEAFAAQVLADGKELGWDWKKLNVHGGAIALGHPIGASGARILATLIFSLQDRGGKNGLASLCLGGGNAVALSIEMM